MPLNSTLELLEGDRRSWPRTPSARSIWVATVAWSRIRRRSTGSAVVGLLVEAELGRGPGLVPARVVVVPRGRVEAELHVVVRSDPLRGVDHAPLEGGEDLARRRQDDRAARLGDHLAAEPRDAHLEALVVADRADLLPEPAGHLRAGRRTRTWDEVERGVDLLPELEPTALQVPGRHALGVHTERDGREPLNRRVFRGPVVWRPAERLDGALGRSVEAGERRHDLAAREDLDLESPAAHLVHQARELLRRALQHVERRRPGRGHPPLDLRLGDDVRGVDKSRGPRGGQRAARLHDESASSGHHVSLLNSATNWW